jgi:outer membrane protein
MMLNTSVFRFQPDFSYAKTLSLGKIASLITLENKMKRILTLLSTMVLSAGIMSGALAADPTLKVGIIDSAAIAQKSPDVKATNEKLKAQFKPRQDKLMAAEKSLKEEMAKLDRERTTLSASDVTALEQKILKDRRDLERQGQDFQQDVMAANNELMKSFSSKLEAAVKKVAQAGGYDIILDKSSVPYVSERALITQKVLEAMA